MNYNQIYVSNYNTKAKSLNTLIVNKLKSYKSEKRSFTYAFDGVQEYLKTEHKKYLDTSNKVNSKLIDTYFNAKYNYERGSEYLVFDNELKNMFDEINTNTLFKSYEDFIKLLGKHYATLDIKDNFKTYKLNIRSMYEISKYENYGSFKKFDLIELRRTGNQALTKELYLIENPEKKSKKKTLVSELMAIIKKLMKKN